MFTMLENGRKKEGLHARSDERKKDQRKGETQRKTGM